MKTLTLGFGLFLFYFSSAHASGLPGICCSSSGTFISSTSNQTDCRGTNYWVAGVSSVGLNQSSGNRQCCGSSSAPASCAGHSKITSVRNGSGTINTGSGTTSTGAATTSAGTSSGTTATNSGAIGTSAGTAGVTTTGTGVVLPNTVKPNAISPGGIGTLGSKPTSINPTSVSPSGISSGAGTVGGIRTAGTSVTGTSIFGTTTSVTTIAPTSNSCCVNLPGARHMNVGCTAIWSHQDCIDHFADCGFGNESVCNHAAPTPTPTATPPNNMTGDACCRPSPKFKGASCNFTGQFACNQHAPNCMIGNLNACIFDAPTPPPIVSTPTPSVTPSGTPVLPCCGPGSTSTNSSCGMFTTVNDCTTAGCSVVDATQCSSILPTNASPTPTPRKDTGSNPPCTGGIPVTATGCAVPMIQMQNWCCPPN